MRAAFVLCTFLISVGLSAQEFELTSVNLTVQDGLAGDIVYCAMQDDKGYIWFGTETGVSRYNGRSFENFYMSDGLADNEVFRIDQDSQGRIWFSAYNGRLSYYLNGQFFNPDNNQKMSEVDLETYYQNFFESTDGTIWLSSSSRVAAITKTGEIKSYINSSGVDRPLNFREEKGRIYGVTHRLMAELQYADEQGLLDVQRTVKSNHDTLTFYLSYLKNKETVLIKGHSDALDYYIQYLFANAELPTGQISKLHKYQTSSFWVCSYNGVYNARPDRHELQHYLKGKNVTHVLRDREGAYWFTTSGEGVFYTPSLENVSFSYYAGEQVGSISALLQDREKTWFGGAHGKFGYFEGDKIEMGLVNQVIARARIRKIISGRKEGEVLISAEEMLVRAGGTEQTDVVRRSSKTFAYWQDSLIAIGTGRGFSILPLQYFHRLMDDVTDETNRSIDKGPSALWYQATPYAIIDIEAYQDGLLLSTSRGLYSFNKDFEYKEVRSHPAMREIINDIVVLNEEDYLLATHGLGTFLYQNGQWINFSTKNGLTSDIHRNVLALSDTEFWVATNTGLNKVTLENNEIITRRVTKTDGLLSEDVSDVIIYNNKIYAATSEGISIIDLNALESQKAGPLMNIRGLSVEGKPVVRREPELKHTSKNIELNFDGLHFTSLDRVSYQYRLLGLNETWSQTSQNRVNFGSLLPGEYTFQVMAESAFNSRSEVAELSFVIAAPIWNRWWFIVLLAAVFVALVVFVAGQIIRKNKRKAQRELDFSLRMAKAERKALQSQLNPHFIFNSLNSIQKVVLKKNPEAAYNYLEKFSRLIRRVLEFSDISMVSIKEELETLRLYMDLENLRLGDKFDYTISVGDEVGAGQLIPSLIIQPYVENSIWHGITPLKGRRRGKIEIAVFQSDGGLFIHVKDNGVGRVTDGKDKGMGTKIVNELVNKFKGEKSGEVIIEDLIEDGKAMGTKVSIHLLKEEKIYDTSLNY
ncbi:MAG: histidine kinase [Roseivirga sp.]|nr:histidine kinase [Roseivirga sp.]